MKIQKTFEANNEQIGWKEIERMISDNYEVRAAVDELIEAQPESKIKVFYNLIVEII